MLMTVTVLKVSEKEKHNPMAEILVMVVEQMILNFKEYPGAVDMVVLIILVVVK